MLSATEARAVGRRREPRKLAAGEIENRAPILSEVVEAVIEALDPARVGVKLSPMNEHGPMAAHDETLPMAEYAVRELDGYGLLA